MIFQFLFGQAAERWEKEETKTSKKLTENEKQIHMDRGKEQGEAMQRIKMKSTLNVAE